jgi:hypothetical protein
MAGVLNFTLGLNTAQFLTKLGAAGTALGGFVGLAATAGKVMNEAFAQMNKGDRLGELSARTGETVGDLLKLEHAFDMVGLQAGGVAPMLSQMQKALGGVNEQGEPTAKVFEQLGLDIAELKGLDAPAAIEAITKKLAGLNKNEATNLASKIFGRNGAGDAMQIARSANDFADAITRAAPQAARMERSAGAFSRFDTLGKNIRFAMDGLFLGLAEQMAPQLNRALAQIDLAGMALETGDFAEMVSLQLGLGFEKATVGFATILSDPRLYAGMTEAMLGALAPVSKAFLGMGMIGQDFSKALAQKGLEEKLEQLSLGKFKARGFDEIFAGTRADTKAGMEKIFGTDAEFARAAFGLVGDGTKRMGDAVKDAWGAMGLVGGAEMDRLKELTEQIRGRFTGRKAGGGGGGGGDAAPLDPFGAFFGGSWVSKFDSNSLERVGARFALGGDVGSNSVATHTRNIHQTALRTNQILERVARRLETPPAGQQNGHLD